MTQISYKILHFPPSIVQQAIWLYVRFNLSWRDVEELLAERGIEVSYETIRRWVGRFGPQMAARLRKSRITAHPQWHVDDMYISIGGRWMYLWRAIDQEGEVLDRCCHVWTAPFVQEESLVNADRLGCGHVSGLFTRCK